MCTVSGLTSQTLIAPSSEAVARRLPLADHASAVTAALWLADVLELTRFLRTKSPPLSATAGAVPDRLPMGGSSKRCYWHGAAAVTAPLGRDGGRMGLQCKSGVGAHRYCWDEHWDECVFGAWASFSVFLGSEITYLGLWGFAYDASLNIHTKSCLVAHTCSFLCCQALSACQAVLLLLLLDLLCFGPPSPCPHRQHGRPSTHRAGAGRGR